MTAAALVPVKLSAPRRASGRTANLLGERLATACEAGRSHPARRHVLALVAVSAISGAATAASPLLLTRAPLALALLAPRLTFLTLAASQTPLSTFLILGVARLALTDRSTTRSAAVSESATPYGTDGDARCNALPPSSAGSLPDGRSPLARRAASRSSCAPTASTWIWAGSLRLPKVLVGTLDLAGTVAYLLVVHAGAHALIA